MHRIDIIEYTGPRPPGLPPPNSGPPSATKVDGTYLGTYYIVNRGTWRCLDAHANGGGGNGNLVGLFDCNGGITEKWHVYDVPWADEDYRLAIINARRTPGRSLDYPASSGGANGWQYVVWDYYPSTGQLFWPWWHEGTLDYEISVMIGGGRNVMDAFQVDGGGNGNRVGNYRITGHPLQRWVFVRA